MREEEQHCIDPRPRESGAALAARPPAGSRRRLVFFDNGKLAPPYQRWMPVIEPILAHLRGLGEVAREAADLLVEPVRRHAEWIARWQQDHIDGVVVALGDAGVASPTVLLAAATEAAGIPTVVVCTDQVVDLCAATAAFHAPGLPLVELPGGRLDGPVRLAQAAAQIAPAIERGLVQDPGRLRTDFRTRFPAASRLAGQADDAGPADDAAYQHFARERRMSDGLPVLAPTRSRVQALVDASGRASDEVLIESMSPSGSALTIEQAAACAVMAGAEAVHFPFVVAALRAMAQPQFQLHLSSITTHPGGHLILFSGPRAAEAGVASGRGCLGPGHTANAVIGRAVALTLLNVGRAVPGLSTLSLIGSPAQLTCCCADAPQPGWPALHTTVAGADDTIAWVLKCESPHNVVDHLSETPESLLRSFCGVAATIGGNNAYLPGDLLLILNPEHAQVLARAGWQRGDVQRFVWEHARHEPRALEGRGVKSERPAAWKDWERWPVVASMERVWVVVAGAPGPQSQVAIPWGYGAACWAQVE
jgi:hypothetical protein